MAKTYFVKIGAERPRKLSAAEVVQAIEQGSISRAHRVSIDNGRSWRSARQIFGKYFDAGDGQLPDGEKAFVPPEQRPNVNSLEPQPSTRPHQTPDRWLVKRNSGKHAGSQLGPLTRAAVTQCLLENRIAASDHVRNAGEKKWRTVESEFSRELKKIEATTKANRPFSIGGIAGFVLSLLAIAIVSAMESLSSSASINQGLANFAVFLATLFGLAGIFLSSQGLLDTTHNVSNRGFLLSLFGFIIGIIAMLAVVFYAFNLIDAVFSEAIT